MEKGQFKLFHFQSDLQVEHQSCFLGAWCTFFKGLEVLEVSDSPFGCRAALWPSILKLRGQELHFISSARGEDTTGVGSQTGWLATGGSQFLHNFCRSTSRNQAELLKARSSSETRRCRMKQAQTSTAEYRTRHPKCPRK